MAGGRGGACATSPIRMFSKPTDAALRQSSAETQAAAIDPQAVQGLKSAAVPLIMSFSEEQKSEVRNLAHVMGLDSAGVARSDIDQVSCSERITLHSAISAEIFLWAERSRWRIWRRAAPVARSRPDRRIRPR